MKSCEQMRLEAGLNLRQLADRANVSKSTIARLEKGETMNLQAMPLQKISIALRDRFKELGQKFEPSKYIEAAISMRDSKLKGRAA